MAIFPSRADEMEGEETPSQSQSLLSHQRRLEATDRAPEKEDDAPDAALDRRTRRKLDLILLPFLALLFLLNSLDKSNMGNAETAGFTRDAGLQPADLNVALAWFFAVFVALQPAGAALGRRCGMVRCVPPAMALCGLCTALHVWVRARWQLVALRVAIAALEAGFYPTAVAYLSGFYTRWEFAVRLGVFYGQRAVAGVIGGVLSWAVFRRWEQEGEDAGVGGGNGERGWKSWEVLFVIEGGMTVVVALVGFFWLPHDAETAWFLGKRERWWAEERVRRDREEAWSAAIVDGVAVARESAEHAGETGVVDVADQPHHRLLHDFPRPSRVKSHRPSVKSFTHDAGLSRADIVSAVCNYHIWHLLVCNILSAVPATAFGVFLPLVVKQLSPTLDLSPAASNLLSAPPFAFGAIVLFVFTRWSDRSRQRLVPIVWGLGLLLVGLLLTIMTPRQLYALRYLALCVLLSGSYVASPLTVAWLTTNIPEPGTRAVALGINGWGNLAGIFSALVFQQPAAADGDGDGATGYVWPLVMTSMCVLGSFAGYIAFWVVVFNENRWRELVVKSWSQEQREREDEFGDLRMTGGGAGGCWKGGCVRRLLGGDERRRGDEKLTFRYGM